MSKVNIYTLQLEGGKYYVGRSYNVPKRLNQHYNGEGSVWTKKYKPIRLYEVFLNKTKFDEDKYTLMYMSIFGIENVRGGSFCSVELGGADKYIIKRMICTATDKCVKCEQHGHFFTDCPQYKKGKMSRNESDNSLENEPLSDATSISGDSEDSGDSEQSEEEESLSDATTITEESITEESIEHVDDSPLTRSKKRKLEECEEKNKKQKQKKTKN
tara:strand:- start:305 stop:949 length:645 start_codon:yes stop_codon:yes gene_type:complete